MNGSMPCIVRLALCLLFALPVAGEETGGVVELPRSVYDQLVTSSQEPRVLPRSAPASHALGSARVEVVVSTGPAASATVKALVTVDVLEDEWTLVPVLPPGTAVEQATVGGAAVQLLGTEQGLAWGTRKAGTYVLELTYRVSVVSGAGGHLLALPLPRATSTVLDARLPGPDLEVAVIPAAGVERRTQGSETRVRATIPTTGGVQLSWREPTGTGHALSRASYVGELVGGAVRFRGLLEVRLWEDGSLRLPLLPRSSTLRQVTVDGEKAPIVLEEGRFATLVRGAGSHEVLVDFEVPLAMGEGPPRVELHLPEVPVSRFELTLPGKKEVRVEPASAVEHRERGGRTVATVHVPLSSRVTFTWVEAVPEELETEVRMHAGLYHGVHAEEGVLFVRALARYEVPRGEISGLRLSVPDGVQVNRVGSPSGAVADWRLVGEGKGRELAVFLDRKVGGELLLEVEYDRSLPREPLEEGLAVPLLRANDAQRQRGMVALLQGPDLILEPVDGVEQSATRVGENQLPPFVREGLSMAVGHTYKYVEELPVLRVRPTVPERQQGRFDVRVDSLVSLGEVSLEGASSLELDLKTGRIMGLELRLPASVSLLGLTGPSVRQHTMEPAGEEQRIAVEFTQEMEGRFRLELTYELLLEEAAGPSAPRRIEVPAPTVVGAEVEQGRLAVEALSAVEVQPVESERLTPLDLTELPRQLVLRTTNPILMAYKYVQAPFRLVLEVTPHELVELQPAAIDTARYRTFFTRDGLAVTTARFAVRNSGEQFLRLLLPEGSQVWSTFVDGRSVKPARSVDEEGMPWHLVKIIHSTRPFPVELVFETPVTPIHGLGAVRGVLPRPEILVTHSHWDVYVPDGVRYGAPGGTLEVVTEGVRVSAEDLAAAVAEGEGERQAMEPLRLQVPTAGVHFAFEKIYANRTPGTVGFVLPYASGFGRNLARMLTLLGLWLLAGGVGLGRRRPRLAMGMVVLGTGLLAVLFLRYGQSPAGGLMVLTLGFLGLGAVRLVRWYRNREAAEI